MTKKKIIISIVVIISVIAISLLLIFLKSKNVKISNYKEEEQNITSSNNENEIVENLIADTNTVESKLANTTANDTSSNIENVENTSNTAKTNTKKTTNTKQEVSSKPSTQVASSTSTKANTSEIIKEETPTTQQVPSTSNQQQVPVKEYKRNDTMINKIKQVIQANETDNMKNFGYNIVVDSSIKGQTNQFTFAENRVINSIKNKFGTIKIYAEDFYKNGQLVMTECYIL